MWFPFASTCDSVGFDLVPFVVQNHLNPLATFLFLLSTCVWTGSLILQRTFFGLEYGWGSVEAQDFLLAQGSFCLLPSPGHAFPIPLFRSRPLKGDFHSSPGSGSISQPLLSGYLFVVLDGPPKKHPYYSTICSVQSIIREYDLKDWVPPFLSWLILLDLWVTVGLFNTRHLFPRFLRFTLSPSFTRWRFPTPYNASFGSQGCFCTSQWFKTPVALNGWERKYDFCIRC